MHIITEFNAKIKHRIWSKQSIQDITQHYTCSREASKSLKKPVWIQSKFSEALSVPSVLLLHALENENCGQLTCRKYCD